MKVESTFTLETLRCQLQQYRSKGIEGLPGVAELTEDDRLALERVERILDVMTPAERANLDLLLDEQVRQRIAGLSGTQVKDVDDLLSQVARMCALMRQIRRRT